MTTKAWDLATAAALAAGIVAALLVVRLTAAPGHQTGDPAAAAATADPMPHHQRPPETITPTGTPPTTTSSTAANAASSPPGDDLTVVLSSGVAVQPRADQSRRTFPAPDPPPPSTPMPPPEHADPAVFDDPQRLAVDWLTALCWWDHRSNQDANLIRAAQYGSTAMPPGGDPWTLTDRAWADVTARQLSSGCVDVDAAAETLTRPDGSVQVLVRVTATQVLSSADVPFQAEPITEGRTVARDPSNRWLIGPPITAN